MRFPLTEHQALILVKLINNEKLLKRDMDPMDMVILTQVGAIKITTEENNNNGITITKKGKLRLVKRARKNELVED